MRRSVIRCLMIPMMLLAGGVEAAWLDSATVLYVKASVDYDSTALASLSAGYEKLGANEQGAKDVLLLAGLVEWRRQLIAFCTDDKKGISRCGVSALGLFDKAASMGADAGFVAAHKALVCQLLATLGLAGGTKYGPAAARELARAKTASPDGYFTALVEAVNFNQAPSFAGGNPKKAVELLGAMAIKYPDSVDVLVHYADALEKTGSKKVAQEKIAAIVRKNPRNLLAIKVQRRIGR